MNVVFLLVGRKKRRMFAHGLAIQKLQSNTINHSQKEEMHPLHAVMSLKNT